MFVALNRSAFWSSSFSIIGSYWSTIAQNLLMLQTELVIAFCHNSCHWAISYKT